jgi:putative hydrolase of the HAD superfamily
MIKRVTHIIFDLGGVLVKLHPRELFAEYLVQSGLPSQSLEKHLSDFDGLGRGHVTLPAIFQMFREEGFRDHYDHFEAQFNQLMIAGVIEGVMPLLERLKGDFHLSILSNTNACHVAYLRETTRLWDVMDAFFFSNELGCLKPEPLIYKKTLESLQVQPEQILFLDDTEENVIAARREGWGALHVQHNRNPGPVLEAQLAGP